MFKFFHKHNWTKWFINHPTNIEHYNTLYKLERKCKICGKIEHHEGLIQRDFEGNISPYIYKD